ncbi:MAG: enoyl-CoA hydratase-related protein, partial [Myxococcota bacterium]
MTDFRAWAATLPPGAGRVHVDAPIDGVAWIRLDHAATRNALDPAMMLAFADATDIVRDARVVILTGESHTFCSGGNLVAVRDHLAVPGAGHAFGAFMQ